MDWHLTGPARRRFARLSRREQVRVVARLDELCASNDAGGLSKALHGELTGVRSIRVGPLRILYERTDGEISVLDIGPRGDIYKR